MKKKHKKKISWGLTAIGMTSLVIGSLSMYNIFKNASVDMAAMLGIAGKYAPDAMIIVTAVAVVGIVKLMGAKIGTKKIVKKVLRI